MKKIAALLLVLCMLLTAIPALGEGPSGNWYMTLADVSLGYILLNEDGTANLNIASQVEATGTWTVDGDNVTITAEGEPLTFVYDGTSLKSDVFPLSLGREEGRLPMNVIVSMMSGEEFELPEGMTEDDVRTSGMNFIAEYSRIMEAASASADSGEPAAEPPAEPADEPAAEPVAEPTAEPAAQEDPAVTIVKGTFKVVESYSGFRGVYIARIQNNTSVPLFIRTGSLKVMDASGNQAGEATYLSSCGSRYLEPGEISFISMTADLAENGNYTYEATIESRTDAYFSTDRTVKLDTPEFRKAEGEYGRDTMRVTVINDSEEPLPNIEVVFVLEDADGNLLDLNTESLFRHELGANSTITLVTSVDSKVMEFCAANGIEPTTVEAYGWVENNDW